MAVRHAPRNRLSVQVTAHPDRWSHKQNSAYGLLNSKTVFALNGECRFLFFLNVLYISRSLFAALPSAVAAE